MNKIAYNAMSGMAVEMHRQEIIAANLAAVDVPGYKSEFLVTSPFLNQLNEQGLDGVKGGHVKVDFEQGALKNTGRRLDFALQGEGFFQVGDAAGKELYTRNGAFRVDSNLRLITDNGMAVLDENNNEIMFLPQDDLNRLEVSPEGELKVMGDASQNYAYRTIGKLKIRQIANPEDMERLSGSYFRMKEGTTARAFADNTPEVAVRNAALEEANVSAMKSMTMLIQSSRDFEMCNKVMRMLSESYGKEQQTFNS
ncbi:MAG: flagellar hook basal-body protein [Victivallales bacterium]|nr:flagellar hook basal-body protein [Victivallales bacterium]